MAFIAQLKLTAQGQISLPAEVRKHLGVGPGSVLEWSEADGEVVVRRAGKYSSADVHLAIFGKSKPKPGVDVKAAIRARTAKRHARR